MNRERLISILQQVQGDGAAGACTALLAGAVFEIWGGSAPQPARRSWAIWEWRRQCMQEDGVESGKDFATALPALEQAGQERVHLGLIYGADRKYILFLSEDLERCVACL